MFVSCVLSYSFSPLSAKTLTILGRERQGIGRIKQYMRGKKERVECSCSRHVRVDARETKRRQSKGRERIHTVRNPHAIHRQKGKAPPLPNNNKKNNSSRKNTEKGKQKKKSITTIYKSKSNYSSARFLLSPLPFHWYDRSAFISRPIFSSINNFP